MKKCFYLCGILLVCIQVVCGQGKRFTVAQDGSGDFKTVQQAVHAVPDSSQAPTTIFIRNGTYKEKLRLPESKINVRLIGQSAAFTILTFDDYASRIDGAGRDIGTSGSASFFINGDGFSAENITFENAAGPVGQAVAARITGDRAKFIRCRFLGFQDTLYTFGFASRQYCYGCYIEGTVDFIFGSSTALFDSCTIFGKQGGYYTAASTPGNRKFGYVFINCTITGDAPANSFLPGRPWRPHARTVFIRCNMGNQVKAEGWDNWGKVENEKTAFYAEYNNRGAGAATGKRVAWSHQLTPEEAKEYTITNILLGWNPAGQ